jgi:hypothetical protein
VLSCVFPQPDHLADKNLEVSQGPTALPDTLDKVVNVKTLTQIEAALL